MSSFTLEAWVRPDAPLPPGFQPAVIFDWGGRVVLRNSEEALVYTIDLGGIVEARIAVSALPPEEWHHVAATFSGSQLLLLIDGKIVMAKSVKGEIMGEEDPAAFGAPVDFAPGIASFSGSLDELRIWDHVRTVQEVEELMNDHLRGGEEGLLGYWDLDEGSGPVASDGAGSLDALLGDSSGADARDPEWTRLVAPIRKPDLGFFLGFQPAGPLPVKSGEAFQVICSLRTSPGATPGGVISWGIAVRHDPTHLILNEVVLDGTAADLREANGFAVVDLLEENSRTVGFMSRVVLSGTGGKALPPSGTFQVARARYRGTLNFTESLDAIIYYDERMPENTAGPPRNVVIADGQERLPQEGRLVVELSEPEFSLGFEPGEVPVAAGREFTALSTLTSDASSGANAWSIAVTHDPDVLEFLEATVDGTVLEDYSSQELFTFSEEVDNESGVGFISTAIFVSTCDGGDICSLPARGTEAILAARYRVREGAEGGTRTLLTYTDGLKGSGVPVDNHVTFIGGTVRPEKSDLVIRIAREPFLRGEVNGDGLYRISDIFFLIDALFRDGKPLPCLDAADVNDDGWIKISDPIYLISFLFQDGPPPPPPLLIPDDDPTPDSLDCENSM